MVLEENLSQDDEERVSLSDERLTALKAGKSKDQRKPFGSPITHSLPSNKFPNKTNG